MPRRVFGRKSGAYHTPASYYCIAVSNNELGRIVYLILSEGGRWWMLVINTNYDIHMWIPFETSSRFRRKSVSVLTIVVTRGRIKTESWKKDFFFKGPSKRPHAMARVFVRLHPDTSIRIIRFRTFAFNCLCVHFFMFLNAVLRRLSNINAFSGFYPETDV